MFEVLDVYIVGACGFIGFGLFDCYGCLVCGDQDGLVWKLVYLSDDVSGVSLCFVWCYVCELFGEVVCFVFVRCSCASVKVDGGVRVGRGLFVIEFLYSRPKYVGISSMVPVSVQVLSPKVFTVLLYVLVDLSV